MKVKPSYRAEFSAELDQISQNALINVSGLRHVSTSIKLSTVLWLCPKVFKSKFSLEFKKPCHTLKQQFVSSSFSFFTHSNVFSIWLIFYIKNKLLFFYNFLFFHFLFRANCRWFPIHLLAPNIIELNTLPITFMHSVVAITFEIQKMHRSVSGAVT